VHVLAFTPEGEVRECAKCLRTRNDGLVNKAANSAHGQPAILQFLELEVGDLLLALSLELRGAVERSGEHADLLGGVLVHVRHAHLAVVVDRLHGTNANEDLSHHLGANVEEGVDGVGHVVQTVGRRKVDAVGSHEPANHGKHGHAAVLELSLAQPLDIVNFGEPQRIELGVALFGGYSGRKEMGGRGLALFARVYRD